MSPSFCCLELSPKCFFSAWNEPGRTTSMLRRNGAARASRSLFRICRLCNTRPGSTSTSPPRKRFRAMTRSVFAAGTPCGHNSTRLIDRLELSFWGITRRTVVLTLTFFHNRGHSKTSQWRRWTVLDKTSSDSPVASTISISRILFLLLVAATGCFVGLAEFFSDLIWIRKLISVGLPITRSSRHVFVGMLNAYCRWFFVVKRRRVFNRVHIPVSCGLTKPNWD